MEPIGGAIGGAPGGPGGGGGGAPRLPGGPGGGGGGVGVAIGEESAAGGRVGVAIDKSLVLASPAGVVLGVAFGPMPSRIVASAELRLPDAFLLGLALPLLPRPGTSPSLRLLPLELPNRSIAKSPSESSESERVKAHVSKRSVRMAAVRRLFCLLNAPSPGGSGESSMSSSSSRSKTSNPLVRLPVLCCT
jgi:hypothetical protein